MFKFKSQMLESSLPLQSWFMRRAKPEEHYTASGCHLKLQ
jgi:hypothetical protein